MPLGLILITIAYIAKKIRLLLHTYTKYNIHTQIQIPIPNRVSFVDKPAQGFNPRPESEPPSVVCIDCTVVRSILILV